MHSFTPVIILSLAGIKAVFADSLSTLCSGFEAVDSLSGDYTWTPDIWANDGSGSQCLTADSTSTAFNATWSWGDNPDSVHSYPHVTLNSVDLPAKVSDIASLTVSANWGMTLSSNEDYTSLDVDGLGSANVAANVAVDMFLDPNSDQSLNPNTHEYEIMIWFGKIGEAYPLGYYKNTDYEYTQMMGDQTYHLYQDYNSDGTLVFSWVAESNITSFSHDLSPLIQYIWKNGFMDSDVYLGTIAVGSETFHADEEVRFATASGVNIEFNPGAAPELDIEAPIKIKSKAKKDVSNESNCIKVEKSMRHKRSSNTWN